MKHFTTLFLSVATFALIVFSIGCHDNPLDSDSCRTEVVIGGVEDNFVQGNSEPVIITEDMIQYRYIQPWYAKFRDATFDQTRSDQGFAHLLQLPDHETDLWQDVQSAQLTIRFRCLGGISNNDAFQIASRNAEGEYNPIWSTRLWFFNNGSWKGGDEVTVTLDLADMPEGSHEGRYSSSILDGLKDGELFLIVEDDTAVDFVELKATTCPCPPGDCLGQ